MGIFECKDSFYGFDMRKIGGLRKVAGQQLFLKLVIGAGAPSRFEHAWERKALSLAQFLTDVPMLLWRLVDPRQHLAPSALAGGEPFDAGELMRTTHAREHHLFGGRLETGSLGLRERVVTRLLHVPAGDHREWATAVAWATAIARTLTNDRAA